jgi:hypothetical protein
MRINRDHPWLKGCKFFAVPDGTGTMRNLMGGAAGSVNNAPAFTRLGQHPALDMVQGSSQYTEFGQPASYGFTGPSVTVLTRARPDALGSTNNETAFVSAAEAASAAGYLLMFSNFGGSEVGWCFVVYGGGTFLLSNDGTLSATLGREVVAAGRYDHSRVTCDTFVNGKKGSSGASAGSWDVTPAGSIFLGKFLSPDIYADGRQAWVMIFDRALADGEIARLSRDWEWPFLDDDLGEIFIPETVAVYATVEAVSQAYTVFGPVTYTSALTALGAFGGDLTAADTPAAATFTTTVSVSQTYQGGEPTLVSYTNVVGVSQTLTVNTPVVYETEVSVRQRYTGLMDGRRDLIGTRRYRR